MKYYTYTIIAIGILTGLIVGVTYYNKSSSFSSVTQAVFKKSLTPEETLLLLSKNLEENNITEALKYFSSDIPNWEELLIDAGAEKLRTLGKSLRMAVPDPDSDQENIKGFIYKDSSGEILVYVTLVKENNVWLVRNI
ncbi:MAG: hypothetical protein COU06_01655 [Candidatus Harrisonbacteria bacterium CG10_big_fil_rev_8_21_14_0_10_38_8]|uniref:Uncharacterized protein n=1 Tax=Candidatus Harrisonbacteria bacterium CG10_big_fil_rev_8_21_14_0_10_38_8 TaxID=1974582 RepID=A0A2M6WJX1_9BACT|nr:MAG: hypothetical protein COU06_01655 [Candidatus Harrisonbacteria bacterium CG10_big_fil_rev_8_21_14_0_10_38_8]